MELLGRDHERQVLRDLLERARAGRGGSLVVRAEAGAGKTCLVDDAIASATAFTVTRVDGIESEVELAYAGLHRLLLPFLGRLDHLPVRQRDGLRVAFGLAGHEVHDRFAVGLATLSLLDAAAAEAPVLCVVDDVQWTDRDSLEALALAARRLGADRIAFVFAGRDAANCSSLDGLPELRFGGLDARNGAALVQRLVDGHLDADVVARIVSETAGTPLAMVELAREFDADELAIRGVAPEPLPIGQRLESHFRAQVQDLPTATRDHLLLIAAEPTQDTSVIADAAARLGLDPDAADAAVDRGLLLRSSPPVFRHPLIRSAIYGGASTAQRRLAHRALAEATNPVTDSDRRAWHRAEATIGPDESIAADLEASAARAGTRGGHAAAGLFLSRSADLTPDRERRADRTLAAASSHLAAGLPSRARSLLDAADLRFRDPERRAGAMRLEGAIEFASGDMPSAAASLMRAAHATAVFDVPLARRTLLHAAAAARFAGTFAPDGARDADIALAARHLPLPSDQVTTAPHLLLEAYATLHLDGNALAMPVLRRALAELAKVDATTDESLLWLGTGAWVASTVADDDALHSLSNRAVDAAREQGALAHLANGLLYRAMSNLLGGSLRTARRDFSERAELLASLGVNTDVGTMVLAAWAGHDAEARAQMASVHRYAVEHELGWMLVFTDYARTILEIGLGNYDAALAGTSTEYADDSFLVVVGFPNVIEALARAGRLDEAKEAHAIFAERAKSIGGTIAPGLVARTDALLADGDLAETRYRDALELLASTRAGLQLARAHLVYGEWLRRQKRQTDARRELRTAHDYFVERGVGGFARRARIELEAAGEQIGAAPATSTTVLTPQEAQVADLAAEGFTNQEIAAKLFLSASTVDYHLRKVFRKLGIASRRRLRDVLR